MTRSPLRALALAAAAASTLAVAACGDDDSSSTTSGGSAAADAAKPTEGKQGGKLNQLSTQGDVDFIDPGQTYYSVGFQIAYATHRPLFSYKPGVSDPVPDLAEAPAEVSADSKTVTVKLRKGVKFGPPVNRDVTSEDVKYAIERGFSANVGGQYMKAYFSAVEGAPDEPTDGVQDVSGITTPDPQTIVFELSQPSGATVAGALSLPISAPVPEEYAKEFDAKSPTEYNTQAVASGPYMVENDAQGKLTGYKPGKSIRLVRNPNWDKATDYRPAYLDEIDIKTNVSDASVAAQQVLKGSGLVLDTNPPAAELKLLVQQFKDQYAQESAGNFRYFPLNTTVKPFDDLNVRKAVLAGFDREAARKARGGEFIGPIASHFLPPDFPGHEESGGEKGFDVDFLANPRGDMAVAAKYMKAAGYASGKYEGDEEILVVGANADPGKAQAEVAKAQLEKLGFKVNLRTVPQDAVYTEFCQVPPKNVGMCGGANWGKDFNDAITMLEPLFKGANISPKSKNINYSELRDPKIDAAFDKAAVLQGDERVKAYANINRMVIEAAAAVPFLWDKVSIPWSKDVNGVINAYQSSIDLTFTSLK